MTLRSLPPMWDGETSARDGQIALATPLQNDPGTLSLDTNVLVLGGTASGKTNLSRLIFAQTALRANVDDSFPTVTALLTKIDAMVMRGRPGIQPLRIDVEAGGLADAIIALRAVTGEIERRRSAPEVKHPRALVHFDFDVIEDISGSSSEEGDLADLLEEIATRGPHSGITLTAEAFPQFDSTLARRLRTLFGTNIVLQGITPSAFEKGLGLPRRTGRHPQPGRLLASIDRDGNLTPRYVQAFLVRRAALDLYLPRQVSAQK